MGRAFIVHFAPVFKYRVNYIRQASGFIQAHEPGKGVRLAAGSGRLTGVIGCLASEPNSSIFKR
jgi:hypothetical protein